MDIALWNQAERETLKDEDGQLIADACDLQMREDVAPAYGLQAPPKVSYHDRSLDPDELPPGILVIVFSEDAPTTAGIVAGRVGRPPAEATAVDRDAKNRRFGRVYVRTILDNGGDILKGAHSVAAATSHECVEATYDPDAKLWVWDGGDRLVAAEVCDAVEEDAYEKVIRGRPVSVSNFAYSAFYDAKASNTRFDHMGLVPKPFTPTPGGYLIVCERANPKPHPHPPQQGWPAKWKDADTETGFARTRVRLVW